MKLLLRALMILCVTLSPAIARAHELGAELSGKATRASARDPRGASLGAELNGEWELSEAWYLHGNLGLTRQQGARSSRQESLRAAGGWIGSLGAGVDWLPSDRWMLGAEALFTPNSVQVTSTDVRVSHSSGRELLLDAALQDATSAWGVGVFAAYLHPTNTWIEPGFDVSVTSTRFASTQTLASLQGPGGQTFSPDQLRAFCDAQSDRCPSGLRAAIDGKPAEIQQSSLQLGLNATVWRNTDLGVGGTFYIYNGDPTNAGYFTVTAADRGGESALGNGLPIAPLQYALRGSLAQRIGPVSLSASLRGGPLVGATGRLTDARLRATWRVNREWRLSMALSGSVLVDGGEASRTGGLTFGVTTRF